MRDLAKFREKIKECLKATGLTQSDLAVSLDLQTHNYTDEKLSRQLNDKVTLTPMEILEIVRGLVRIQAVKRYSDVQVLLEAMEVDFDEADWECEPLTKIKGRPATNFQKRAAELEEENRLLRSQLQVSKETAEREQEVAAARAEMEKATSREEQLVAYRRALQADQNLALIHVLDMTRPLSLDEMYIKLRLHEHKKSYKLETELVEAETKADPNEHIRVARLLLANKTTKSYEPTEAIRQNKHMVVLGDPGAGKTTMMKYLALRSARGELKNLPDFPVHVILSRLAPDLKKASETDKEFSLVEWIADYWQERYNFPKKAASQLIEERFGSGEALLLLDGLDETVTGGTDQAAKENYDRVTNLILNFTNHYPKISVIITVRFAGFSGNLPGFVQFEVLDFTTEDIEQFVNSWYRNDPEQGDELREQLKRNPRVETLAANPLLLTLIAIVFEGYQGLPKTRTELYEKCVETLLEKWDNSRRVKRVGGFGKKQKERLLTQIGWHFHKCRQRYLRKKALGMAIRELLPVIGLDSTENEQILYEIVAEHGLLKEQASGYYGFLHLTLQEYFAALYAANHPQVISFLVEQRDDPWWHEVILLYVGEVSDANPFFNELWKLVEENRDDIFHNSLLLASECLAIRRTLPNPTLKIQIIEQLFKLAFDENTNFLNYSRSIEMLVALKEKEILRCLFSYIVDNRLDEYIRGNIVEVIGELRDCSVLPQFLTLLADNNLANHVRGNIALAIGKLRDRTVLPQLLTLLTNNNLYDSVRMSIAEIIGKLRDRTVLPQLLTLLTNNNLHNSVRMRIVEVIGELGDRTALPQLLTLLADSDLSGFALMNIFGAIGELGDRAALPQLLTLLADSNLDNYVRGSIAETIGKLGDHTTVPQLLTLLADNNLDNHVRGSIAEAIGELGDRTALPQLLTLLADNNLDNHVRGNIAKAIGELGDHTTVPQLLTLLADNNLHNSVRGNTAWAIGKLGDHTTVPQLLTLLADSNQDRHIGWNIAWAIGKLGDRAALPQLLTLLADNNLDIYVRGSIAETIGKLGDHTTVPQLLTLLADNNLDNHVRMKVSQAIEELGKLSTSLQLLLIIVTDSNLDNHVRGSIAEAIGKLGDRAALPQLLTLLADSNLDNHVRGNIAKAIGELGDRTALPQLLTLLADSNLDNYVSKSIAEATIAVTQTLEDLSCIEALLQNYSIFSELYKATQRIRVRIYWVDKPKKIIRVVAMDANASNNSTKPEKLEGEL